MAFPRTLLSSSAALCDHTKIHGGIRNAGDAAARHHSGKRSGTLEITERQTITRRAVILSGKNRFASESVCGVEGPLGEPPALKARGSQYSNRLAGQQNSVTKVQQD